MQEYKIADARAKKEWEELLGMKIHSDRVRVPLNTWVGIREEIWAIQMSSAMRIKHEFKETNYERKT